MKFSSTVTPAKAANPAKEKNQNQQDTPAKAANPAKEEESLATLANLAVSKAENQDSDLAALATLAGHHADILQTIGVDVFVLKGQAEPQPIPARTILDLLHAEVRFIDAHSQAEATIAHLLNSTAKISRYPGAAGGMLGVDIETAPLPQFRNDPKAGLDPYKAEIRLIQLFDPVGKVYVFDLRKIPLALIQPLLESREMVAHNAMFEMKHLRHAGIKPLRLHCTLLMARVVSGQPLMSLAKAAAAYLPDLKDTPIDKTLQVSNWSADSLTQDQLDYAALDAVLARELWRELGELIKTTGQSAAYRRMAAAVPVVADQMLTGMGFNADLHRQWLAGWQSEQLPLRDQLQRDLQVNPDSGTQLGAWLERNLDPATLAGWPRTPTGKLKTDEDAFEGIDLPEMAGLKQYKHLGKKISAFGTGYQEFVHPVTGRLHADYLIAGTRGGRFSCGKPNLQQAPSGDFRRLFVARPGYALVVADYSQIELRIVAIIANDPIMLEAYRLGADLHKKTAAAIAGIAETDVTKAQRQLAKACNFGLIYGMGAKTLAAYASAGYGVAMSLPEADKARSKFFATYPGIHRWQSITKARGISDPTVKTAGGLIRDLSKEPGGWQLTKALNTPVQGTGAEMLLAALAQLPKALSGLDAQPIHHVHDEIALEVAEGDVAAARTGLVAAMVGGFKALFPDVDMPELVEAHSGPDWYSAKG